MGLRIKFKFKPGHKDYIPKDEKIKSIFWNLTNRCTHSCIFCYAKGGQPKNNELNLKESLALIDEMVECGIKVVTLSGGEPLLDKKFYPILKKLSEYDFRIKICTNGYLLDSRTFDRIAKYNVATIQLSLNSLNKDVYYKMTEAPKDAFKKALNALEIILQQDVGIHTVVSTVPLEINKHELLEMMNITKMKGIETFSIYKPVPSGRGISQKYFIKEEKFIEILDKLIGEFFEDKNNWLLEVEIPYFEFSEIKKKYSNYNITTLPCRAGKYFVGLTSDGFIIPCPALEYADLYYGNIRKERLTEIIERVHNIIIKNEANLKKCKYFQFCRSGCKALSYILTGKISNCDPMCKKWIKW